MEATGIIKKQMMTKELPAAVFIVAMVTVLALSLGGLTKLYFILYPNASKSNWELTGPVTTTPKSLNLEVGNPEDELLTFEKSIIISGKTSPGAIVLINNQNRSVALEANSNGDFSKVIELENGINRIIIATFDAQGSSRSAARTVYYEEEKL